MTQTNKKNKSKKKNNEKHGFMKQTLEAMDNSKAAFYLAFIGIIIQFVHNLLAVAGTFNLFASNEHPLLIVGEWTLAVTIGLFFAGALFYFTIKAGSIKMGNTQKEEKKEAIRKRQRKYRDVVLLFAIFDSFIDAYFWIYIVFLESDLSNIASFGEEMAAKWILLIVILPIVVMLPQTLRLYSGEIEYKK